MQEVLKVLQRLASFPDEYKLSLVIVTAFFWALRYFIASRPWARIVDKAVNERLPKTQVRSVILLALKLAFAFSVILLTLVIAAPELYKHLEARRIAQYVEHKEEMRQRFRSGDYTRARDAILAQLQQNPDLTEREYLEGLAIWTYYRSGDYRGGLGFLCGLFKDRPSTDKRHMFSAHALVRKIAVTEGAAQGERRALEWRRKCRADIFSPFFAHIPLAMMESLNKGRARSEHSFFLPKGAPEALASLLIRARHESQGTTFAFEDVVLYFLGRFDEILERHPKSALRELALYDAGMLSKGVARIAYLTRFLNEHPTSRLFDPASDALINALLQVKQVKQALEYEKLRMARGKEASVGRFFWDTMPDLARLVSSLDFDEAAKTARLKCAEIRPITGGVCPKPLAEYLTHLSRLRQLEKRKSETARGCLDPFFHLRSVEWRVSARNYLSRCLVGHSSASDGYPEALYLLASVSKRIGDYNAYFDTLNRFLRETDRNHLTDDVLAEIGWFQLWHMRDYAAAKQTFLTVVNEYPESNAYDNALWWLAKLNLDKGDYAAAAQYYGMVALLEARSRLSPLGKWGGTYLPIMLQSAPFNGVTFGERALDFSTGVFVEGIARDGGAYDLGVRRGDRLLLACGRPVFKVGDIMNALQQAEGENACVVLYRRGRYGLQLSRNRSMMGERWDRAEGQFKD